MIAFAFEPRADDDSWAPDWPTEKSDWPECPGLTNSDFRLELFQADLRLVVHGVDLGVHLSGQPVVDFALMLHYATTMLETQSDIAVEASLTQHVYAFSRDGDSITLTTEWPPRVAQLTWPELRQLTDQAKAEAFRLITTAHPGLRDNAWLRETVGASPAM
ncbi:hypothetical protein [Streptomyces sp. SID12488]|uniref:hypothetical protein n=1 Tax=Streptomyces sp. SID12488 TaxID=2706040 RepID=UPI0013DC8657|nr:hypothetical protein [Streptomyces sp. SID12488]NEA63829.1 hypothetical protein [Streptomyces sp. SID12488]